MTVAISFGDLSFGSTWLLVGILAAAIPIVLHLLSSVRAPQMPFPTLRFLKISMEKTARRRRVEHWLLLLVRSLLLALLAIGVAEPILAAAGFRTDRRFAAVVVLDNSYSMGVRSGGRTRLDRARGEIKSLLEGDSKPTAAALMPTNGGGQPDALAADLAGVRERLAGAALASKRAPIAERLGQAAEVLAKDPAAQKAVYLFSDLQVASFDGLKPMKQLKQDDIPIMLVDCAEAPPAANVGVADLKITGRRIVRQPMTFAATLINSSRTDRTVEVLLQIDGHRASRKVRKPLKAAGRPGAKAVVRFAHSFAAPGTHVGRVVLADDDGLAADNVRRFSLRIAGRVGVLLVRGAAQVGGAFDPARSLQLALDPFGGGSEAWSVRLRTIQADAFAPAALAGAQAVFCADVPRFTPDQAGALRAFVRRGGTAVFFLGPSIDARNYNDVFAGGEAAKDWLLPGRIGQAVGQVGPEAKAVRAARNLRHRYLTGLYETAEEYPPVIVQRYYRFARRLRDAETILSTPEAGHPIASSRRFGAGRVVLFATTASVEWNNLATTALMLPMVTRMALEAGEGLGGEHTHPAGTAVAIRPTAALPEKAAVNVKTPDGDVEVLPLKPGPDGPAAVFTRTARPGIYEWQVAGLGPEVPGGAGAFAVNIDGSESDLAAVPASRVAAAVRPADLYHGRTLAEVHEAAAEAAGGDPLWDRFLAVVILLLVVEAVVANRFRRGTEPVPAHVSDRLAA